ncbi:protein canopy homolog 2-like isoform X1 [Lytechinus variegatus]|uniref:protein canopy homolog 2-like isoform X1 n=1 Tax=Lytechinus variegatus TaxID=7654 RepID=UPI001BB1FDCD|nr:protein canopy homolog 2-like isoform X1 [Lytechinus variegatus]
MQELELKTKNLYLDDTFIDRIYQQQKRSPHQSTRKLTFSYPFRVACRALISEVEYAISQEDPRQTITVGSFRIDPTGKQKQTKIPYAGSEAHLTEVMENVCDKMTDYAERIDPETNEKTYVRYQARNGEDMELTNVSINVVTGKILKVACENIIEEYEDEVLRLYREKSTDIETRLCSSVTQLCEGSSSAHTEL